MQSRQKNVFAFQDVTQTWLQDGYQRFFLECLIFGDGADRMSRNVGTFWIAWPLKMGPITCAETSLTNYQSTLHDISFTPQRKSAITFGKNILAESILQWQNLLFTFFWVMAAVSHAQMFLPSSLYT